MSILFGTELNPALIDLFNKKVNTAIVATIDQNYFPHTAPFNFIVVRDPKHLRIAVSRQHLTFVNIIENGYVALAVLDEGDIAVCIKGFAQVVKDNMETDINMAIVEIEVVEIKKNNSSISYVTQGIRTIHKSEPDLLCSRQIFRELTRLDGNNHR